MTSREWVPNRDVDDSALAVEAALPELRRMSKRRLDLRWRVLGAAGSSGGGGGTLSRKMFDGPSYPYSGGGAASVGGDFARSLADDRLRALVMAASELADDLSGPERLALRETGRLPGWFLPATQERAKEIRRQLER